MYKLSINLKIRILRIFRINVQNNRFQNFPMEYQIQDFTISLNNSKHISIMSSDILKKINLILYNDRNFQEFYNYFFYLLSSQLMKSQKLDLYKQPIQEISIFFQKPIQISPPSTPEEIYTIQPKSSCSTLNNKNTNVLSNSSNSQRILQQNSTLHLPRFPKSISPKKLCEQYISPLRLKESTYNNIESPISIRLPNRRATKLCSKVLQKYKKKYYM